MSLQVNDVWTWRQLVQVADLMVGQTSLLNKAEEKTLELLDAAICRIWWVVTEEFDRREDPRHE